MSENGPEPTQPIQPQPTQPIYPNPIQGQPQDGWSTPHYGQPHYGQPEYGQPQQPAPLPGHHPGPQQPGLWQARQDDSGATPALVVGIVAMGLGFVGFGFGFLISPIAMVLGWRSKRRIDASNGVLGGRANAQAGFVLGLIGTILLLLGVLLLAAIVIALFAHDSGGTF